MISLLLWHMTDLYFTKLVFNTFTKVNNYLRAFNNYSFFEKVLWWRNVKSTQQFCIFFITYRFPVVESNLKSVIVKLFENRIEVNYKLIDYKQWIDHLRRQMIVYFQIIWIMQTEEYWYRYQGKRSFRDEER